MSMKKEFKWIKNPTPEQLNEIKAGDIVKLNNYKNIMKVQAVSQTHFIMTDINNGDVYSICEKIVLHNKYYDHQYCEVGHCSIGADNYWGKYDYQVKENCEKALLELASGKMILSRNCASLKKIGVKYE